MTASSPGLNHEMLIAIGVSVTLGGIVVRGLINSRRRDLALRRQHALHHRKLGEAVESLPTSKWKDKYFPLLANLAMFGGLGVTAIALLLKITR